MFLASFDIFDTVLIRKCGKPANIFYLLARKLYPEDKDKRENFVAWRREAEERVANNIKGRETTIADIYTAEGVTLFHDYTPAQLIEAEKEVEADNLTANPAVKAIIEKCRAEGKTICFISDMYLDSEFLARVLKREGCLTGEERVYVSCEEGARKSTGALYDKVRNYLNPAQWEHYGDHPVSDVKRAINRGIEATQINTAYTKNEKHLADNSEEYGNELSCLAGLQRTARIKLGNNPFSTLAADFVAPAYIPYVKFILEKAKEHGIKRLYFLSRDSYILQKIAETEQANYPDVQLKYLFVSRKALLLPYLHKPSADKFIAIQDKQTLIGRNTEELLQSIGTSLAELKEKYSTIIDYTKIESVKEEKDFIEKIFGTASSYKSRLQELAQEERTLLNEYFAQEGLFDNVKTAMVDVGWLGTTRLMINSILKEEGYNETLFFYYGIRGDVLDENYGKYYSYNTRQELSTELTTLIENYFSASPYPSTIGYCKNNGRIEPCFKPSEEYNENNIIKANTAACEYIAKEIALNEFCPMALKEWCKRASQDILSLKHSGIDLSPLREAEPFDGKPFVKELSVREMLNIILLGGRCTAFDKASVKLSVGNSLFPIAWEICQITGKIRRFLYLKLKKQK